MILLTILFLFVLPFAFVLFYGAPYLPTRQQQAKQALDMLNLKKGDVFVDLGSGDGAVLVEAARRGLICYGYELNPLLWFVSRLRTIKYGSQVTIRCRNFWNERPPEHTKGVFVFLLDKYMARLNEKLMRDLPKGARVVSYTFQIPNKKIAVEKNALYLYKY